MERIPLSSVLPAWYTGRLARRVRSRLWEGGGRGRAWVRVMPMRMSKVGIFIATSSMLSLI